jgi:hypothetical protein
MLTPCSVDCCADIYDFFVSLPGLPTAMELEVFDGPADYSLDVDTHFYDTIVPYFNNNNTTIFNTNTTNNHRQFASSMTTTSNGKTFNGFNGGKLILSSDKVADNEDFKRKKNRKKSVSFLPNLVQVSEAMMNHRIFSIMKCCTARNQISIQ